MLCIHEVIMFKKTDIAIVESQIILRAYKTLGDKEWVLFLKVICYWCLDSAFEVYYSFQIQNEPYPNAVPIYLPSGLCFKQSYTPFTLSHMHIMPVANYSTTLTFLPVL